VKRFSWLLPLLLIAAYNLWVLWLDSAGLLPNPIASHWGISGQADGFSDVAGHLIWANFALLLSGGLLSLVLWYPKIYPSIRKLFVLILGYFALFMFGLMTYVIAIQIGVSDPTEVKLGIEFIWAILPVFALVPLLVTMPKVVINSGLEVRIWNLRFLRLEFSEIQSVSQEFLKPTQYGGLGLRVAGGKVAFIPSKGPALRIDTNRGEVILVRSNQVENLIAAIQTKI
jgi:hypothetical protein